MRSGAKIRKFNQKTALQFYEKRFYVVAQLAYFYRIDTQYAV